ncbi:hypothetical protein AB0M01_36590, partial [Kribbella sp. NPDC051770]
MHITNATVLDGTGAPAFAADVQIEAGRIATITPRPAEGEGPGATITPRPAEGEGPASGHNDLYVAILGTLQAGAAYVPVDA